MPDQPKSNLVIALLCMVGLWVLYPAVLVPNWWAMITSDHVVPYLMTVDAWSLQDFCYWGAKRYGAVYSVFWKAFLKPIFGNNHTLFFWGHLGCFFIGTAFWIASIPSRLMKLMFVLIMVPTLKISIHLWLLPGQLYGVIYLLMAIHTYLVTSAKPLTHRRALGLAIVAVLAYWQHAMIGFFLLLSSLLRLRWQQDHGIQWRWRSWSKSDGWFWASWLFGIAWIEQFKKWASVWDHTKVFRLESARVYEYNLNNFLEKGISVYVGPEAGWVTLVCLLLGLFYGAFAILSRRRQLATDSNGHGIVHTALMFSLILAAIFAINSMVWYTLNAQNERYFAFALPLIVHGLASLVRKSTPRLARLVCQIGISSLAAVTLYHNFLVTPTEQVFRAENFRPELQGIEAKRKISAHLLAKGCTGVIANYWQAYDLAWITNGRLVGSPDDVIRNPLYHEQIVGSGQPCLSSAAYQRFMEDFKRYDCEDVGQGYMACKKPTTTL